MKAGVRGAHMSWMETGETCRLHVLLSCVYCQEQKKTPLLSAFNSKLEV